MGGRKKLGFAGNLAIGCLLDIVLIVGFALVMSEERLVNALAYAIILAVPVWLVRWLLNRLDLLDGWWGRLLGPAALVFAMYLSIHCPIETDKPDGGNGAASPHDAAEKVEGQEEDYGSSTNGVPHWALPPPSGIRYMPASTNEVTVEDYHMVFTGNPGTGKTTVARIMAKIYKALGVVKNGHLVECDRGGLVAGYTGQTAIKTAQVIDFALDGILFVDEAYSLVNGPQDSYGDEAISTLLKRMEDDRDRLVVIVAGYTKEMKRFIDANSGLASRFSHYVEFPDYTADELAEMFRMNAKKSQYVLSADVDRDLGAFIAAKTANRDQKFGNGRWVRNLFEQTVAHQAERVADIQNPTPEQLMTIEMRDIGELGKGLASLGADGLARTPPPGIRYMPASTNEVTVEKALAELNGLVGLKPVKEEVAKFASFVRVAQQRKAAGLKVAPISYHMVFTGNPGTGKTTVARIMATTTWCSPATLERARRPSRASWRRFTRRSASSRTDTSWSATAVDSWPAIRARPPSRPVR